MQITEFRASWAEKYGTKSPKIGLRRKIWAILCHREVARSQIWTNRLRSPLDFMLFGPNVSCKTPKISSLVTVFGIRAPGISRGPGVSGILFI